MYPSSRSYMRTIDWLLVICMLALMSIGLLFVLSTTYTPAQPYSLFFKKQCFGVLIGIGLFAITSCIDYRSLMRSGYFTYFFLIGLLGFTLIKGHIGMGGQRWINLFFFKFQPSEISKCIFPAFTSYYLYEQRNQIISLYHSYALPLVILCLSFILILRQPDLGTALLILIAGILMLWIAGIRTKFFAYALIFCACAAPLFWYCLKDYQKQRIRVFLGQGQSHKERYQIEQAAIAIGSGGITGKGFLQGTQNKLRFLPEGRTDFIFAVICEELGFCGSMIVLLIYTMLFIHFFNVIRSIKQPFIQLCAFGSSIHIVLSTIINICMVLGLLPVVGIPLPFISAGVSNLWVNCISMGIFHSIVMHHNQFSD